MPINETIANLRPEIAARLAGALLVFSGVTTAHEKFAPAEAVKDPMVALTQFQLEQLHTKAEAIAHGHSAHYAKTDGVENVTVFVPDDNRYDLVHLSRRIGQPVPYEADLVIGAQTTHYESQARNFRAKLSLKRLKTAIAKYRLDIKGPIAGADRGTYFIPSAATKVPKTDYELFQFFEGAKQYVKSASTH